MALAGRKTRRRGGGRLVVVAAIVVTLLVLLVDASIKSRSPAPARQLASQSWVDRVLPLIRASSEQGLQIADIRAHGIGMPATAIATALASTANGAASTYHAATKLSAPPQVTSASGLLEACLLVRSQSARAIDQAIVKALSGPASASAMSAASRAIASAAQNFQVADKAYQLFAQNLPGLGIKAPSSVWASNPTQYQAPGLGVYLTALRNSTNLRPLHQLSVVSLSTTPPAESLNGTTQVLPTASAITVGVVVADTGNQVEDNLTVTASISGAGRSGSARAFVSLTPGRARSLTIGNLYPPQGVPVTLTVTVTPRAGSSTPVASRSLTFEMPSPNKALPTTTTSTTTPSGTGGSTSTSTPSSSTSSTATGSPATSNSTTTSTTQPGG